MLHTAHCSSTVHYQGQLWWIAGGGQVGKQRQVTLSQCPTWPTSDAAHCVANAGMHDSQHGSGVLHLPLPSPRSAPLPPPPSEQENPAPSIHWKPMSLRVSFSTTTLEKWIPVFILLDVISILPDSLSNFSGLPFYVLYAILISLEEPRTFSVSLLSA